jgi:hypothetical protein
MNRQLKAAIVLRFDNQSDAAQALGLQESRLSRLIRERVQPSERDIKAFARIFGPDKTNALLGGEDRPAEAGS